MPPPHIPVDAKLILFITQTVALLPHSSSKSSEGCRPPELDQTSTSVWYELSQNVLVPRELLCVSGIAET